MNTLAKLNIDLRQMILALETMIDLVGMNDTNHGKRVGYIAGQIAHRLGFSEEDIHLCFELGLLHDCGVSTEQMHSELVNHFDWCDAHIHCEIGYELLKDFEPLKKFAVPILYHHTPYEELTTKNISSYDATIANLIFLADRIDVMSAAHYETDILLIKDEIVKTIESYSGTFFDPKLVQAFKKIEKSEAFWISLGNRHIMQYTWDMKQFENKTLLTIDQLKQLSLIMAYIVDQKSSFTAQHSTSVGYLAKYLANEFGLSAEQCDKIEIAGFLHDIGKLRMPDSILEKPGPLTDIERSIMNQHSYETFEILRQIQGLEEISLWAAYHHEHIEGTGYPFHPTEKELDIEARIIAVADVFQALVQDRPYRKGMPLNKVLDILDEFAEKKKLDETIINIAKKNSQKCFDIAKGETLENKESEIPLF